jgi:hypothetical protein
MNPIHTIQPYFIKIQFNIIQAYTCWATRPVHLILFDFIIPIINSIFYLRSPSLCSFFHPSVTSSLLSPNILLSTRYQNVRQQNVYYYTLCNNNEPSLTRLITRDPCETYMTLATYLCTVRSVINRNATVTSRLPAGTAGLTAKC